MRRALLALTLISALAPAMPASGGTEPSPLHYSLGYAASGALDVELRIDLPEPLSAPLVLAFPRVAPLGEDARPYDRFVTNVRAFGPASNPLFVERLDGPRWRLGQADQQVASVRYDVNVSWMENELREAATASKVRPSYAGLLGYSVFGFLEGQEGRAVQLTVRGPAEWPVFSTLAPAAPPAVGPLTVDAPDFHALADSQIAMGEQMVVRLFRAKLPLFVVVYAEGKADADLVGRLGGQVLNALIDYFDGAPFPHYTVLLESLKPIPRVHDYDTGAAHSASASFSFDTAFALDAEAGSEDVRRLAYELALRLAPAWTLARCAGEGARPFPWELAPVLDTLWFGEGFADYAATAAVAGQIGIPADTLLAERFGKTLAAASPVLRRMTTIELSRAASVSGGGDLRPRRNCVARGAMMAAEVDELIRQRTANGKGLRHGLRAVLAWCREHDRGFRVEELPALLEAGSGVDVRAVFDKWIGAQPGS